VSVPEHLIRRPLLFANYYWLEPSQVGTSRYAIISKELGWIALYEVGWWVSRDIRAKVWNFGHRVRICRGNLGSTAQVFVTGNSIVQNCLHAGSYSGEGSHTRLRSSVQLQNSTRSTRHSWFTAPEWHEVDEVGGIHYCSSFSRFCQTCGSRIELS
jgi:hypothetical protein